MSPYIIIFAPPGVGLKKVIDKLKVIEEDIEWIDIENTLCDLPEIEDSLTKIQKAPIQSTKICMFDVTWHLPRSKVSELWQIAVEKCIEYLSKSQKRIKILTGHLTYYSGQRDEFFSSFNTKYISDLNEKYKLFPSHVLLLIDDIYDMFLRLTKPNQIYEYNASLSSYIGRIEDIEKIIPDELNEDALASIHIEWQMASLTNILHWRHLENILAENVSTQLNTNFLLWGLKQLNAVIIEWLKNTNPISIYLSHPISRARAENQKNGKWPDYVNEINDMQLNFNYNSITCVQPTAIDEFRFSSFKPYESALNIYTGELLDRWPLPDNPSKVLYSLPEGHIDIHHKDILKPQIWNMHDETLKDAKNISEPVKEKINSNIRTFIKQIQSQIASRDHCLVSHTNGIVVYRPFYGGKSDFSGGVQKELDHWEYLVNCGFKGRSIFIHFEKDCVDMLKEKSREKALMVDFEKEALEILINNFTDLSKNQIAKIIRGEDKENALGGGSIIPNIRLKVNQKHRDIQSQIKINLLNKYLSGMVEVDQELFGIWILFDSRELRELMNDICSYVKTGKPKGNNWESKIDKMFEMV